MRLHTSFSQSPVLYQRISHTILFLFFICTSATAQSYQQLIEEHRKNYKQEFLKDERSPLKKRDLRHLRFFKPDSSFCIRASFTRISDTTGFIMKTHSGVDKHYYVYGELQFYLKGTGHILKVYQSEKLMKQKEFEDYLFVPFNDWTNNQSTFGGGRYLDFRMNDIQNGSLQLDFNKAYNPYCAYKGGYACPIPPEENRLNLEITAGEMKYGREGSE
ncbi:MAG TPA: DUF1684 domain-containing protein [Chitinophagaceae bacterium]|nr:DUF1684 domain-containing protein [Chitinophagaceae bacterium]